MPPVFLYCQILGEAIVGNKAIVLSKIGPGYMQPSFVLRTASNQN